MLPLSPSRHIGCLIQVNDAKMQGAPAGARPSAALSRNAPEAATEEKLPQRRWNVTSVSVTLFVATPAGLE
jgi:hypothetical protein